jgi:hypothetical protein
MPPLMYAQRKKAAATEAHSIAISDRGARFGGRSFLVCAGKPTASARHCCLLQSHGVAGGFERLGFTPYRTNLDNAAPR